MSDVFEYDEFRKVFKVGTKQIPVRTYRHYNNSDPNFPFMRRQAVICFENKWEMSVVWGFLTYSTNHYATVDTFTDTPDTVEVAIFNPDGEIVPDGEPYRYVDVDEFVELFNETSVKASNVNV